MVAACEYASVSGGHHHNDQVNAWHVAGAAMRAIQIEVHQRQWIRYASWLPCLSRVAAAIRAGSVILSVVTKRLARATANVTRMSPNHDGILDSIRSLIVYI